MFYTMLLRTFFRMSMHWMSPLCQLVRPMSPESHPIHKKERIFFFMHSAEALPQARIEYMKRKCTHIGRTFTRMPFYSGNSGSISAERLVSVDAKLSLSTPLGRRRFQRNHPTRRVTVAAWPPMTVSLFCRWFLSRFSSAVKILSVRCG